MTVDVTELMRRVAEKERENERRQDDALEHLREIRPYQPRVKPHVEVVWDLTELDDPYGDASDQYADLPSLASMDLL